MLLRLIIESGTSIVTFAGSKTMLLGQRVHTDMRGHDEVRTALKLSVYLNPEDSTRGLIFSCASNPKGKTP